MYNRQRSRSTRIRSRSIWKQRTGCFMSTTKLIRVRAGLSIDRTPRTYLVPGWSWNFERPLHGRRCAMCCRTKIAVGDQPLVSNFWRRCGNRHGEFWSSLHRDVKWFFSSQLTRRRITYNGTYGNDGDGDCPAEFSGSSAEIWWRRVHLTAPLSGSVLLMWDSFFLWRHLKGTRVRRQVTSLRTFKGNN